MLTWEVGGGDICDGFGVDSYYLFRILEHVMEVDGPFPHFSAIELSLRRLIWRHYYMY
jgi:hypothetical protein